MRPSVRQVLMGSGQQWRSTLPALRSFITANYNQPNPHNQGAMASPPTIAVTAGNTPPVGVTSANLYNAGTRNLAYYGGSDLAYFTDARRFPVAANPSGNLGNGTDGVHLRAESIVTTDKVAFRVTGSAGAGVDYRFIVDDQYATLAYTSVPTAGSNYVLLTFASSATRRVAVESMLTGSVWGIYVPTGSTIVRPDPVRRMIVLGDSFTAGSGTTRRGDALAVVAGDMLGMRDTWCSGVGSTGYVATASRYNLGQRLDDANTTGPWDVIVVSMGLNDFGQPAATISAAVNFCLRTLRQRNPAAQMFVTGPWDTNAPAAPSANFTTTKAAIQAGIPSNMGITFLDTEGVTFTKIADLVHPDDTGHDTLGKWLALQIKNAIGA